VIFAIFCENDSSYCPSVLFRVCMSRREFRRESEGSSPERR
jgi:hypothetical protein